MKLVNNKCIKCQESYVTINQDKYCKKCIKEVCCMSDEEDSFNRNKCNVLLELKKRYENGKMNYYCIGHWKKVVEKCKMCDKKNRLKEGYDKYYYCKHHYPLDTEQFMTTCCAMNRLNVENDVTQIICQFIKQP